MARAKTVLSAAAVAFLLLSTIGGSAVGQSPPPGPTVRHQVKFDISEAPVEFAVLQNVFEFRSGAATQFHSHTGPAIVLVLAGQLTNRVGEAERVYRAGEGWLEKTAETHVIRNASESSARMVGTFIVPPSSPAPSTPQPPTAAAAAPGPARIYGTRADNARASGALELISVILDFAPGAWTPRHSHGGLTVNTVLDGTITLRRLGSERTLKAGDGWTDEAGSVHAAGNDTGAPASLAVTWLLPKGAQLTTLEVTESPRVAGTELPRGLATASPQVPIQVGGGPELEAVALWAVLLGAALAVVLVTLRARRPRG